jgi:guanidinoacetate N-methyltransferase
MRTADLSDDEIMEDWQLPLMEAMARIAARPGGDVLEIGFGRGVLSGMIQRSGVRSPRDRRMQPARARPLSIGGATAFPDCDIRMVPGPLAERRLGSLGAFDAVFFHTYALDEDEAVESLSGSVTLRRGILPRGRPRTCVPAECSRISRMRSTSLGRAQSATLVRHFSDLRLQRVPLTLPPDVRDAWWADPWS